MDRKQAARERALKWRKEHPFPQWFIEDLENSPDKDKVLDCILSVNDNALFFCKSCKTLYSQKITHHLNRGSGCPTCSRKAGGLAVSKSRRNVIGFKNLEFLKTAIDWREGLVSSDVLHFVCPIHGEYTRTVYKASHYPGCAHCNYSRATSKFNKANRLKKEIPEWIREEFVDGNVLQKILAGDIPLTVKQMFKCSKGHLYETRVSDRLDGHGCPTCGATSAHWVSSLEDSLYSKLTEFGLMVVRSCRTEIKSPVNGRPMELDLYLPDYKLAVEVNGLYYHSYERMLSAPNYHSLGDKTKYHLTKMKACEDVGIRLISLWEDQVRDKLDVCVSLILSKLGLLRRTSIGARKLKIEFTDSSLLERYHIQGKGRGNVISLVRGNEILSSIQVRKSPENEDSGSFILDRYASHSEYFVIGGIERLMKFAETYYGISRWVSFADRMVSDGSLYRRLGFEQVGVSSVSWWCVHKGVRYHKFNFRKEAFRRREDLKYEDGLTEFELYALNNVTRVYDCGKIKFAKLVM